MNTRPSACLLWRGNFKFFPTSPLLHLGQMRCWTAPNSEYTGSSLVVSLTETNCNHDLLNGEFIFSMKMCSVHK